MTKTSKKGLVRLDDFDTAKIGEEGAEMRVMHPGQKNTPLTDEDGNEIVILLKGADTKTYRVAERASIRRRLEQLQQMQRKNRNRKDVQLEDETIDEEVSTVMVEITTGWRNVSLDGVTPLEFTKENAKILYMKFRWLREQVEEFIATRANFTKA